MSAPKHRVATGRPATTENAAAIATHLVSAHYHYGEEGGCNYHLWKDTLVIVNTDHGFLLGEHDGWAKFGTLLFDIKKDPKQQTPLTAPAVEQRMVGHLVRLMTANDAPPEQFEPLGPGE